MAFGNGVKNIQAAAYNGARTVIEPTCDLKGKLDEVKNLTEKELI